MNIQEYDNVIEKSQKVQSYWKTVPAPKRGEVIRLFGNKLRTHLDELGAMTTAESKKIFVEGVGEVPRSS